MFQKMLQNDTAEAFFSDSRMGLYDFQERKLV